MIGAQLKKNLASGCWWYAFLNHKLSFSFMIRCTKIKWSKEDNKVQTKKGCCCLVAHWRRLNCVGSLKVVNNVTLWAPNLSANSQFYYFSESFIFYHFNVRHPVFLLCIGQSVFSFWFTDFLPNFFACSVVWPFNAETGYKNGHKSNAGESSKTIFVKENNHFLQQEESRESVHTPRKYFLQIITTIK